MTGHNMRQMIDGLTDQELAELIKLAGIGAQYRERLQTQAASAAATVAPLESAKRRLAALKGSKNRSNDFESVITVLESVVKASEEESLMSVRERYQRLSEAYIKHNLPAEMHELLPDLAAEGCKSIIIWGEPGSGKTTAAKIISEALLLPYIRVDASVAAHSTSLSGDAPSYKSADCGAVARAIVANGRIDTTIIVEEVDKAISSTTSSVHNITSELLSITDGRHMINDNFLGCEIPVNGMVIMTGNDIKLIPEPLLDRSLVIAINPATPERIHTITQNYYSELNKAYGECVSADEEVLDYLNNQLLNRSIKSLRQHTSILKSAFLEAYVSSDGKEAEITKNLIDKKITAMTAHEGKKLIGI